jgi:hypothetical protein
MDNEVTRMIDLTCFMVANITKGTHDTTVKEVDSLVDPFIKIYNHHWLIMNIIPFCL